MALTKNFTSLKNKWRIEILYYKIGEMHHIP